MVDAVHAPHRELEERIRRLERLLEQPPWRMGVVVSVDADAQTAAVDVASYADGQASTTRVEPVPLLGPYLPDVGHEVVVLQGAGAAPVILPPANATITTTSGRINAVGGDSKVENGDFETLGPELIRNTNFQVDLSHWQAGANTTISRPEVTPGFWSLRATSTAGGNISSASVVNAAQSMIAEVQPYRRYRAQCQTKTLSSSRVRTLFFKFFDADMNLLVDVKQDEANAGVEGAAGVWTNAVGHVNAPANARYVALAVSWGFFDVAAGESHDLDLVSVREAVVGWDFQTSATAYDFDTGTHSWSGSSASVALYTGSSPTPIAGAGALQVTRSAGTGAFGAAGPGGTSGVPIVANFEYVAGAWVRMGPLAPSRLVTPTVTFYTSGGVVVTSHVGTAVTVTRNGWAEISMTGFAPGTAAFYRLSVATNGGSTGEIMLIDSAMLTTPSTTEAFVNTNVALTRSGARSMGVRIKSGIIGNVLAPPGGGAAGTLALAIPVVPDEFWDVSFWYKNDPLNVAVRSCFAVATFYGANGNYLRSVIGTFPQTAPGTDWNPSEESFRVPASASYMRVSIVFVGAAGDVVYIEDASVHRASEIAAKLRPDGGIIGLERRWASSQGTAQAGMGTSYLAGIEVRLPNPGFPVRVLGQVTGYYESTSGAYCTTRVGLSIDGGLTWRYGTELPTFVGALEQYAFFGWNEVVGMPTGDVIMRRESKANVASVADVEAVSNLLSIQPAPPAGEA